MSDLTINSTGVLPPLDAPRARRTQPRIVKMRNFGIGEASTVTISVATGTALLLLWWLITQAGLVPKLFLPTPAEVLSLGVEIFREGYANATLWEHVSASLGRILSAAVVAVGLGIPVGLLMGLSRWAKGVLSRLFPSRRNCRCGSERRER